MYEIYISIYIRTKCSLLSQTIDLNIGLKRRVVITQIHKALFRNKVRKSIKISLQTRRYDMIRYDSFKREEKSK